MSINVEEESALTAELEKSIADYKIFNSKQYGNEHFSMHRSHSLKKKQLHE